MISFQPPTLADRSFDDLVAELVRAYSGAHAGMDQSPRRRSGRTLIELFAWLGDALLYRANLMPERQRLMFLRAARLAAKAGAAGACAGQPRIHPGRHAHGRDAEAGRPHRRRRAVRDARRNHRSAGLRRGLHQARAERPGERAPRRGDRRARPRAPAQCSRQGLPDDAGVRWRQGGAGRPRCVRNERRSCAVARPARAGGRAAGGAARHQRRRARRTRRRNVRRRGAPVGRRGAGAGDAGVVRRNRTTRAGTGGVGDHHARPRHERGGLPDARAFGRQRYHRRAGAARHIAAAFAGQIADLRPLQRRRRKSARRRRRRAATARRQCAGSARDRLAAPATTGGQQVDRLPLAWIGINAVEVDQRVTLAGRVPVSPPARRSAVPLARRIGRPGDAADRGRGAGSGLSAVAARRRSRRGRSRSERRARSRVYGSTRPPACCGSATACAAACPSAKCASGWRSAASAGAAPPAISLPAA